MEKVRHINRIFCDKNALRKEVQREIVIGSIRREQYEIVNREHRPRLSEKTLEITWSIHNRGWSIAANHTGTNLFVDL